MKYVLADLILIGLGVSTLVVEWIEIINLMSVPDGTIVSTLVVEWIEIFWAGDSFPSFMSPPSWWSGLKYLHIPHLSYSSKVSTLVVEWIEI